MASTSIQSQVDSIVSRRVAEAKVQGIPAPDLEASAVFESIALNLLLNPRTVLYSAHLARNGVLAAAKKEIAQVDTLISSIQDTANQTYSIKNTSALEKAKTALLQMENLDRVDTNSQAFKTYTSAIDDFLNKQLSKNVKKKGATSLLRPGGEAAEDVPSDYSLLQSYHSTFLDKLYALSVGVDNYVSSPMSSVIGLSTAYRVRSDLQDILDSLAVDDSGAQSRDYAVRLLTSRSALRVIGNPPVIDAPVLDTAAGKPDGYVLKVTSGDAPAVATSSVGPFAGLSSGDLTLDVNGASILVPSSQLVPSKNSAAVFSTPLTSFPLTIPAGYHLFLKLVVKQSVTGWTPVGDGTFSHPVLGSGWSTDGSRYFRNVRCVMTFGDPLLPTVIPNITALAAAITTGLGTANADAGATVGFGDGFVFNGDRLTVAVSPTYFESIAVAPGYSYPYPANGGYGEAGVEAYYSQSAHDLCGLFIGQTGTIDAVPTQIVVDAINFWFSTLVTAQANRDETLSLTTLLTAPATVLLTSGQLATDLGLPASSTGSSSTFTLSGTIYGVQQSPANPSLFIEVGDTVELPTGPSTVIAVSDSTVTVANPLPTFADGDAVITSALNIMWSSLAFFVSRQIQAWLQGKFGETLGSLDSAIAALAGDATPGRRNAAVAVLNELKGLLEATVTDLSDASTLLPLGSARIERTNSDGIIATLVERKFDKAADYFSQCKIQELFTMDYQTASYAGSVMKAASNFAQVDVRFINRIDDEDARGTNQTDRGPER